MFPKYTGLLEEALLNAVGVLGAGGAGGARGARGIDVEVLLYVDAEILLDVDVDANAAVRVDLVLWIPASILGRVPSSPPSLSKTATTTRVPIENWQQQFAFCPLQYGYQLPR